MSITADNTKDCRFLFGANPECLVLKKELSFTFTGDGKEDENFGNKSSKVKLLPKSGQNYNGWYLVFPLDKEENYALHVTKDDKVTATKYTGGNPPDDTEFFVPKTVDGRLQQLTLGSNQDKCLAVNNMQDKSLTVKDSKQHTQPFITIFLRNDENI